MPPFFQKLLAKRHKAEAEEHVKATNSDSDQSGEAVSNSLVSAKPTRDKYGLFLLYEPPASEFCSVDVIAVHGLGGDWETTWTHRTTGKLWLRDFLPQQFGTVRVMSFGYDSAYILSASITDINDASASLLDRLNGERQQGSARRRPIIFVAHSLGGIVVKRALNLGLERSDQWKDMIDSIAGVIFFAVPHRGADAGYWANLAANAVSFATLGTHGSSVLVRSLKRNSEEFSNISQAFIQPAARIPIIRTFYETVKIGNQLIVDKDSASLHLPNELAVPIQGANHRDICRFEEPECQKYRPVKTALHVMVTKLENSNDAAVEKLAPTYGRLAQAEWQSKIVSTSHVYEDFKWITCLAQYRSWIHDHHTRVLYIDYEWPGDLMVSLTQFLEETLRMTHDDIIWWFVPPESADAPNTDLKESLARSLIGQIFTLHPSSISKIDEIQEWIQIHAVDQWQEKRVDGDGRNISWKNSFCSPNAAWQHLWSLLACAICTLPDEIIIILAGFHGECYEALKECLKYLSPISLRKQASGASTESRSLKVEKFLVLGKPWPDHLDSSFKSQKVEGSARRICDETERLACLNSMYFPELHARRNRVEKSEKGTNKWMWTHPVYSAWHDQNSSLLWIYGKPGCGKSTLAATLLRSLEEKEKGFIVADFFYSSRGGSTEVSHRLMMQSILYQLLERNEFLYPVFRPTFRRLRAQGHQDIIWPYAELCSMFSALAADPVDIDGAKPHRFLLLLDGLDESEEKVSDGPKRQSVLHFLFHLCSTKSRNIFKIIALSRAERDITGALCGSCSIDMRDVNGSDIERIVHAGMANLWRYITAHDEDQLQSAGSLGLEDSAEDDEEEGKVIAENTTPDVPELDFLRDYILKHADGVTLWVVMIIRELLEVAKSGTCTMLQLQAMLSTIPTSLNDLYRDVVRKIRTGPYSNIKQARYVFSWVLFAGRTLRVDELRDAIAMFHWDDSLTEKGGEQFLRENRVGQLTRTWNPTRALLSNICGGFLEIVPCGIEPSQTTWKYRSVRPDDYVQLIHQTAKDFLLTDPEAKFLELARDTNMTAIVTPCVNYFTMTLSWKLNYYTRDSEVNKRKIMHALQDRPLLAYILEHLSTHLRDGSLDEQSMATAHTALEKCFMFGDPEHLSAACAFLTQWAEEHGFIKVEIRHTEYDSKHNSLPVPDVTQSQLLASWISKRQRARYSKEDEPLYHTFVVRSNVFYLFHCKLILFACELGLLENLRILRAVSATAALNTLETGISEACQHGHHLIVRFLLAQDADSNFWGQSNHTHRLHLAITGGHLLVVKELLKSPKINIHLVHEPDKKTSVQLAESLGHTEIVQLLDEYDRGLYRS